MKSHLNNTQKGNEKKRLLSNRTKQTKSFSSSHVQTKHQQIVYDSPQVRQLKAIQNMANETIQRQVNSKLVIQRRIVVSKRDGTRREIGEGALPWGYRELRDGEGPAAPIPEAHAEAVPDGAAAAAREPAPAEGEAELDPLVEGRAAVMREFARRDAKPSERDLHAKILRPGLLPIHYTTGVLGTDYGDRDVSLLTEGVAAATRRDGRMPAYMAAHLYNTGQPYRKVINKEFIGQLARDADRVDVAHSKIQDSLNNSGNNPRQEIQDHIAGIGEVPTRGWGGGRRRHARPADIPGQPGGYGTPEEVNDLINGVPIGHGPEREDPTHEWVPGRGFHGQPGFEPGHLRKIRRE